MSPIKPFHPHRDIAWHGGDLSVNLRIGKALVVDGEEKTLAAASHLLLSSAGQPFDYASSLVEAAEFLRHNNYVCIFAASQLPAIAGAAPRRQDLENLLDILDQLKGACKPPVVCLYSGMSDMEEDNWTCWVTDMTLKGVVKWVKKPFPSSGRTPDRMLRKILNGHYVRVVQTKPLTPEELMAAPVQCDERQAPTAHARRRRSEAPRMARASKPRPCETERTDGRQAESQLAEVSRAASQHANHPDQDTATASPDVRWRNVPNEPIDLDDFMAKFCEHLSKKVRMYRKRALLAAARHNTVRMPPLAAARKHGQSNKYFTHDLLAAWQGFLDEAVDVPPLLSPT
jgi:CheY-like chemotaxis protein